ncbi:hypothetical protein Isop_1914 [Isosphaera pallida ATCC 43644]|uniref:N-acetyltransferase domain-containing protein n=1 Tax=Isosphaera pallida (strain ATCC 43644 / DSM 9630 / IS1B) TaxID=575540 RepID=E8R2J4_ISOPI|nr:hypothetical protein [Isosphaera pallida]ADV62494.1 hypothetical protein Isop_1914 [Isosphaera pallida ATCC 43644]
MTTDTPLPRPPWIIRPAQTIADFHACREAQRRAWKLPEDGAGLLVPIATLVGVQHHGGLVLGAFLPDGSAAGVSFAFPARIEGEWGLYSQLTGVVPDYQSQGLGRQLKRFQFDFARRQGLSKVAWAFDPLQTGNARFNLTTLGATARRYLVDMYGPRYDPLTGGAPTDRLIAVWSDSDRPDPTSMPTWDELDDPTRVRPLVGFAPDGSKGHPDPIVFDFQQLLIPRNQNPLWLSLAVPGRVSDLRRDDPERAFRWLSAVRAGFIAAFQEGWRAVGFVSQPQGDGRGCYLLTHPARCCESPATFD